MVFHNMDAITWTWTILTGPLCRIGGVAFVVPVPHLDEAALAALCCVTFFFVNLPGL